ncbi:MAG: DUF1667 domain-containing protein [Clostridia bacterium]|nr:DUF1667 domain-containing protein [Clostridia bacterium]
MELICIVCPKSCHLTVDGDKVSGNGCKRGELFAKEEAIAPKRSVTTTVATAFCDFPVLPVKTESDIPKAKIEELMQFVRGLYVTKKLKCGDVVAENILGLGINLVATESVFTQKQEVSE